MSLGRSHANAPPEGVTTSTLLYRVPFFDTDGMRIVHHSNYVRYLELARVQMLAEHVAPYEDFVAQGLHFAVTRCELRYRQSARFGEEIDITCWIDRLRTALRGPPAGDRADRPRHGRRRRTPGSHGS